jgi:hypothetical protein
VYGSVEFDERLVRIADLGELVLGCTSGSMASRSFTLPAAAAICLVVDQQRALGIVPYFDHADCSPARRSGQRGSDCMGSDLLSFTLMRESILGSRRNQRVEPKEEANIAATSS